MITKAIERAYTLLHVRDDTIFWCIDLHGVCLASNYVSNEYGFINEDCVTALKMITACKYSKVILWSSCHVAEQANIINFFNSNGIRVDYFNENPLCKNTTYGCFDTKFYFSVLIDDKAGFDPDVHWKEVIEYLKTKID